MHFPLKKLVAATLFAASFSAITTPAFANISADREFRSFQKEVVKRLLGYGMGSGAAKVQA